MQSSKSSLLPFADGLEESLLSPSALHELYECLSHLITSYEQLYNSRCVACSAASRPRGSHPKSSVRESNVDQVASDHGVRESDNGDDDTPHRQSSKTIVAVSTSSKANPSPPSNAESSPQPPVILPGRLPCLLDHGSMKQGRAQIHGSRDDVNFVTCTPNSYDNDFSNHGVAECGVADNLSDQSLTLDGAIKDVEVQRKTTIRSKLSIPKYSDAWDTAEARIMQRVSCRAAASFKQAQAMKLQDPWRANVATLLASWKFDVSMGVLIMMNIVCISLESSLEASGQKVPAVIDLFEIAFVLLYSVELGMRVFVSRWECLKDVWIRFDAFLVICGIVELTVKTMLRVLSPILEQSSVGDHITVLGLVRLMRLARSVRLIYQFQPLWLMLSGLFHCAKTIICTFVLMLALIYIFAIAGLEFVKPDPDAGVHYTIAYENNFSHIGVIMLTLTQCLLLDAAAEIYRPLVEAKPLLIVYFVTFILIGYFALTNLVTALMVDNALKQAKGDQMTKKAWDAARKKALLPKLMGMFAELDLDNNGALDLHEVRAAPAHIKEELRSFIDVEEVEDIYSILDSNGAGEVTIEEFCDAVYFASTASKPLELKRIMQQCNDILAEIRAISPIQCDSMLRLSSGKLWAQVRNKTSLKQGFQVSHT